MIVVHLKSPLNLNVLHLNITRNCVSCTVAFSTKTSLGLRGHRKIRSTCCCLGQHRGSLAPMREAVQLDVIDCGVHQVRNGNVTGFSRQPELQSVYLLLRVTDPDYKAIKVSRHCAPGQTQVMWARGGRSKRPQLGNIL